MIARILEFSLRQRAFVLLATALLVGVGLWSAARLPIDAVPDITNVQVQINTEVPALAPEEIEKLVTFPLETELSGVPGLVEMRSLTKFGLSQITAVFDDGTDIYRVRQLVSERLQNAAELLPRGLTPQLAPITTGLGEIYFYTVDYAPNATNKPTARREQLMALKLVQEFTVKPLLRTVPGLAEVNASGGFEKQIVVQPQFDKLRDANLSFSELADVIRENVDNSGGGTVNRESEQVVIRGLGRVQTMEEIAELPVKFAGDVEPLLVRDVADVAIGTKFRTGAGVHDGEEAVVGTAMMLAGENSRLVAMRVKERLAEIQERLPAGMVIRSLYDRSDLVDRTIHTVGKNLFEGAVLVVVILLAFLGNWRAALIVASAIPLSFLFAMTGMVEGKISGNLMSLGAIDFGLIIDGAVVMVENILRQLAEKQGHLKRKLTTEERAQTVLAASKQMANPTFFGVLIIGMVYLPIMSLTGIEGKMFHPMAVTVMLALGGALALTLTLMPVLCSFALRGNIKEGDNFLMRLVKNLYAPSLDLALRLRWLVVGGAVGLLVLSVFIFNRLGAEFVPQLDEGSLTVQIARPASISLDASIDIEEKAQRALTENFPEIETIFSRLGTPEVATDPMGVNLGDTFIMLKPPAQWRKARGRNLTKEELAKAMTEVLEKAVPGNEFLVSQPIEMRFNELMEGVRADIAVKISGNDYDTLEKIAGEVKEILEKVPGAEEVEFEPSGRLPTLEIQPRRDVLRHHNLHVGDLNKTIQTALGGETVGSLIEDNRRFDVVVRLPESARQDNDVIRQLPVRVGEQGMLPLGEVAEFKTNATAEPIMREFGQRRSAILVNLAGRDVESFVHEAEAKVKAAVQLPEGYNIEFGGQFKHLREARARLAVVVPTTLAMIFVLVFLSLRSVRQTLIIYTGVPLAAAGGIFSLWILGMPFSISAAVGFIALSGVAVLDGLVMISCFNQLREEGRPLRDAVREGSLLRLRPILMTALVASFGFVPMAIATGAGAEVQRPLAVVVIGGLLTSTFLKLVLLPVLYEWFEGKTRREIS
jgi:cobalt-zinc-cadmium resistance protein CzcA